MTVCSALAVRVAIGGGRQWRRSERSAVVMVPEDIGTVDQDAKRYG